MHVETYACDFYESMHAGSPFLLTRWSVSCVANDLRPDIQMLFWRHNNLRSGFLVAHHHFKISFVLGHVDLVYEGLGLLWVRRWQTQGGSPLLSG